MLEKARQMAFCGFFMMTNNEASLVQRAVAPEGVA